MAIDLDASEKQIPNHGADPVDLIYPAIERFELLGYVCSGGRSFIDPERDEQGVRVTFDEDYRNVKEFAEIPSGFRFEQKPDGGVVLEKVEQIPFSPITSWKKLLEVSVEFIGWFQKLPTQ